MVLSHIDTTSVGIQTALHHLQLPLWRKNKHQIAQSIISECSAFCLLNSEGKNVATEAQLSTLVMLTVLCIKSSSWLIYAKERLGLFELDEVWQSVFKRTALMLEIHKALYLVFSFPPWLIPDVFSFYMLHIWTEHILPLKVLRSQKLF